METVFYKNGGILKRLGKNRFDPWYLAICLVYFLFLLMIIFLADTAKASWVFSASKWVPWGDKYCHLILIGLFSFFLNSAFRCRKVQIKDLKILIGSLLVFSLVLGEELSQNFLVSRNFEILDLLFDLAGICIFGILAEQNLKEKTRRILEKTKRNEIATHTENFT